MAAIDEDLGQIERDIRTLKIEYEQYFGGGRPRPPSDTQWRCENMLKRYAERTADLNYAQRFRYNNLSQTYAKYQDMWRKKLIQKESGTQQHHFGAAAKAIEAERARKASQQAATATLAEQKTAKKRAAAGGFALTVSDPAREQKKIEELYARLIEARTETGEKAGAPTLKDFERFVQKKTKDLQSKSSRGVEYSVSIEGGRVKLKAKLA
ncbi:MAG TPA: MXAN_5187 C-terminal domain-containing protein [Candidatus Limnocylindrales bacterium]|nr:MXAN_5187 C-terminal domain-containing protein [Candidatus Limnocylindrales bacterium]